MYTSDIKNLEGEEFKQKYGFKCPTGVRGRNSDNTLYRQKIGWVPSQPLKVGIEKTFNWISKTINNNHQNCGFWLKKIQFDK